MTSAWLPTNSANLPPQGAWEFKPIFVTFDEATAQDLENAMNGHSGVEAQSVTHFYVVEDVEYSTYMTPPPMPSVRFTALVHITEIKKV